MYKYPDHNDALTISLIEGLSQGTYWEESEKAVIKMVKDKLIKNSCSSFLDLGCGKGRLLPEMTTCAEYITAAEPDKDRFIYAAEVVEDLKKQYPQKSFSCVNGDINCLNADNCADSAANFDAVLSSHVIQHIPLSYTCSMLRGIASRLKPGGLVFLSTTWTNEDKNFYSYEKFSKGERITERTDEKGFEAAFGKSGILPVAFYTKEFLTDVFIKYDLCVESFYCFHYINPNGEVYDVSQDVICNNNKEFDSARDVMYFLRKV